MSPLKEPLEPVNENMGSGTGIGTLTPIYKKTSKQYINRRLRGQLRLPSWAVMFSASHISDTLTPWWQLKQQCTRQTQMHSCLPQKAVCFPHVSRHHVGETVCKFYTLLLHVSFPAQCKRTNLTIQVQFQPFQCELKSMSTALHCQCSNYPEIGQLNKIQFKISVNLY